MTIRECYKLMDSDFDSVLSRLGSEAIITRVAVKFLNDTSFQTLKEALPEGNKEEAFRAAHTLKGVAVNLGFDALYKHSSEITELLRAGDLENAKTVFPEVEKSYLLTIDALTKFKDNQ